MTEVRSKRFWLINIKMDSPFIRPRTLILIILPNDFRCSIVTRKEPEEFVIIVR